MITRSKAKIDINKLPKPALFNLIMQLEPREMKIVCGSNNSRVREICRSSLFQKAYSQKYDLLKQPIEIEEDRILGLKKINLTDAKGNKLDILYKADEKTIHGITYTPFKQIYTSTYIKNFNEDELRQSNPIKIDYDYDEDEGQYILYLGRDLMHEVFTEEEEKTFLNDYNKEVKEFLQYISRESWWNPNIQFRDNQASESIAKEFLDEVQDLLKKLGL